MSNAGQVTKIYDLRSVGFDDRHKEFQTLTKDLENLRKAKIDLNRSAADTASALGTESEAYKRAAQAVADARIKELELIAAKKQASNDMKAEQLLRQNEITQQKQITSGNIAAAGSYRDIVNQMKILRPLIQNANGQSIIGFGGKDLNFDQAITKYKELSSQEQSFRRQFAADKTLVGEYTTGINNSFAGMGNIGQKFTNSISDGFKNMRHHAAAFLLTFVGIQSAFQFIEKGVDKFEETEKSALRFEQVVKNLGKENDFDILNKNLERLKKQFQFLSIFDLREASQKLVTFGKFSTDQMLQLTDLAVNLAAQRGQTVAETTQALVKAIGGGRAQFLIDYGIHIRDAKTESEKFAVVMEDVGKRVKGQAAIFGSSASGQIEAYKQKLVALEVQIGQKLFPALSVLATVLFFITANFPALIAMVGLYAAGWALANKEMIIARAELTLQRIIFPVLTLLLGGQANATRALTLVTNGLTAAKRALLTVMQNPYFRIFVGILGLLAVGLKVYSNSITDAVRGTSVLAEKNKFLAEAQHEANKELEEAKAKEEVLLAIVKDRTLADETRTRALNDLKNLMGEYGKALTLENVLTQQGTKSILDYNAALYKKAQAIASTAIAERENNKFIDLITKQTDVKTAQQTGGSISTAGFDEDFLNKVNKKLGKSEITTFGQFLGKKINVDFTYKGKDLDAFAQVLKEEIDAQQKKATGAKLAEIKANPETKKSATVFEVDIPQLNEKISELNKQINDNFQGTKAELTAKIKERDKLQDQLDKLQGNVAKDKPKVYAGAKLSGEQKDVQKEIDTQLDTLKAALEKAYITRGTFEKGNQKISIGSEEDYLTQLHLLNVEFLDKKIKAIKGNNAEEKLLRAKFELEKIKDEQDTNKKIFDILQQKLQNDLDEQIKAVQAKNKLVQDDINLSPTAKAQSQLDTDNIILQLEINFSTAIDALEKKRGQQSLRNEKKAGDDIIKLKADILEDQKKVTLATLDDIDKATEKNITDIKLKYDKLKEDILNSKKTTGDKNAAITTLDKVENVEVGGAQLNGDNAAVKAAKELLKQGLITATQYEAIYSKAIVGQQNLNKAIQDGKKEITSFGELLQNKLSNLFGFADGSDKAKLLAETISKAFSVAGEAMNNFYDAEKQRIEQSKRLTYQKIDLEKQQLLNTAQSQAERDSIERQAAIKKDKADREAFEKNKKLQIAQAKINLAMQLSNLAVVAFGPNPLNIATLGTAGAIMYAIQAALALASYALNVGRINSSTYAGGGKIKTLPNGRINQTPNVAPLHNGDNVLIYAKNGEVILNESQQRMLGGAQTFKALGVPGFASGGIVEPLGGRLPGSNLLPPVNPSSFLNNNGFGSSDLFAAINQQTANLNESNRQINERIDKFQVLLDPHAVEKANDKNRKATTIGTL